MLTARTRTGHISGLVKCSSVLIVLLLCTQSFGVEVSGLPVWLEGAVVRSLNAVWEEIPGTADREGVLSLVAARLFSGYDVRITPGPVATFTPKIAPGPPEVRITPPALLGFAYEWFTHDTEGLSRDVASMLSGVPPEAMTWGDEALREAIGAKISERLPGWEFTQQIYIFPDRITLTLAFRPSSRMILAVRPEIYSRTIPVMFRSDLEAKLIPALSPLIGLPVLWAQRHARDIEDYSRSFLEERNAVDNMRADVRTKFLAGTEASLEAGVDSHRLTFDVWVSAYAGISGKYPDAGIYFGWRPGRVLNPEIYGEVKFSLEDFGVSSRVGVKSELVNNFWAGGGIQWPEAEYFVNVVYDPVRVRRPYFVWRWYPGKGRNEASLGYRIDEHISIELYYDGAARDKVGVRGLWHL